MPKTRNPAGQLAEILGRAAAVNGNMEAWKAWSNAFNVGAKSAQQIYPHLIKLNRALDETIVGIKKNVEDVELYLTFESNIRYIIAPSNLDMPWQHFKDQIKPEYLFSLRHCSNALSKFYPQEETLSELPKIKQQLASLMEEVNGSSLPDEVKSLIISRIESLLAALDDFQTYGITNTTEAAESVIGAAAKSIPSSSDKEENLTLLKKVMASAAKADAYVHVTHAVAKVADRAEKFIDYISSQQ